jgi:hypothetical protein
MTRPLIPKAAGDTFAQDDLFVARQPWVPTRPETLVVCCSDGRWHAQVEEFIHHEISERADLYAVPGGPAELNLWSSSFDEAKVAEKAFRFLAEHHELEAVWLIAHQDCAYYKTKYGPLDPKYIFKRQREDVRRAAERILSWYPNLRVRSVYASIEAGQVVFRNLLDEWQ